MIRVLVVDDSSVQQELIAYVLSKEPMIQVVDTARDGLEAIKKVKECKPDVVTMDIHMPKMDGIEATKKIMATSPVPIIIVSGTASQAEVADSFEAIEAGAVALIDKFNFIKGTADELIQTIKLMSEVKVVKRHQHLKQSIDSEAKPILKKELQKIRVISLGASTGGPLTIQEIFNHLPEKYPPIMVVQHISPGFLGGFAEWLSNTTKLKVTVATDGEILEHSHVYLAPDNLQMGIDPLNRISLKNHEAENGHRPSVSYLFRSTANVVGENALGILLTGMGRDGADGLKVMREAGAFTIAQDETSSIVYGMPKEAVAINAVSRVLSPLEIAQFIKTEIQPSSL